MSEAANIVSKNTDSAIGRVVKYHNHFYYADYQNQRFECFLKGNLKKESKQSPDKQVFVGDWVLLDSIDKINQSARISDITERRSIIYRPKVANVDLGVIVFSAKSPDFDPVQVDKYLIHILKAGLSPVLCISPRLECHLR